MMWIIVCVFVCHLYTHSAQVPFWVFVLFLLGGLNIEYRWYCVFFIPARGKSCVGYVISKHFPPDRSLSFLPLNNVFHRHLKFLMTFKWLIIYLTDHAFGVVFESLPNKIIKNVPALVSSRCFMALGFTFSLWPILS